MAAAASAACVQVLSTGADESRATGALLLQLEQMRWLFNCPEVAQRFCEEHGVRLAKVSDILVSSLSPHALGGLPGVLLTLRKMRVSKVALHGPQGLAAVLEASKSFCHL